MDKFSKVIVAPTLARFVMQVDHEFTKEQHAKIRGLLGRPKDDPAATDFLRQTLQVIGTYKLLRSHAEKKPTPKETLTRLHALRDQVNKMLKALNPLDPSVEALLDLAYQDPTQGVSIKIPPEPIAPLVELTERLTRLRHLLNDQIIRMRPRIQRGRKVDHPLRHAIYGVVEAYHLGFGSLPPTTLDSNFEKALTIILETCGIHRADLHKYIRHALIRAKGQKSAST